MEQLDSIIGDRILRAPKDEPIRAFLLIGQSNMAGRGTIDPKQLLMDEHCYMLRMGRWQSMVEPLNVDRCVFPGHGPQSGASLGTSFAICCANEEKCRVGLIPCADGGTSLQQWMPGGILFDHAVFQCQLAERSAELCGILWHQGEYECGEKMNLEEYQNDLVHMMRVLREKVGNVPIVLGELGYADQGFRPELSEAIHRFNAALPAMAAEIESCAVASAADLPCQGDALHFSTPSLRTFGERYWSAFKAARSKKKYAVKNGLSERLLIRT